MQTPLFVIGHRPHDQSQYASFTNCTVLSATECRFEGEISTGIKWVIGPTFAWKVKFAKLE